MNIEETKITKNELEFFVENIEDVLIRVDVEQVFNISVQVPGVDENEIVILLATIKSSRMVAPETHMKMTQKANDELATRSIIKLLECYSIDNLTSIFEEMKYFEIKEVLEARDPISQLQEYI